jgi:hypothetical protein
VSVEQILIEACTNLHAPLLRRALECGANANAQGPRGQLAIEIAISAQADSLQCVEILLPFGISLDQRCADPIQRIKRAKMQRY